MPVDKPAQIYTRCCIYVAKGKGHAVGSCKVIKNRHEWRKYFIKKDKIEKFYAYDNRATQNIL